MARTRARNADAVVRVTTRWSKPSARTPTGWIAIGVGAVVGRAPRSGESAHRVGREDRDLRDVDDGHRDDRAERARIGDGERAARDIVRLQVPLACALRDFTDLRGERTETQRVGIVHDRHDEVDVSEVDCDSEVHRVVGRDRVTGDGRVAERELLERVDHRARHERKVRQPGASADEINLAIVAFHDHVRVRGGGLRLDEPACRRTSERG